MAVDDILKELEGMGSASVKAMLMKNHGVREPCFGVKIGDMKSIVKRVKVDHELALALYDTGNYDAMYLAGLIADDARMTKRDLDHWVRRAEGGCLASATVAWVAAGSPHGWEMAMKWIESKTLNTAVAGWATLSCLVALKEDAELDLGAVEQLVTRIGETIHDVPDFIRYGMNQFVISVGAYIISLTDHAIKTAKKIGVVTAYIGDNACKIPAAVDYIRKIEARGALGKKRKKVKC